MGAQIEAGEGKEADATVKALRKLPFPTRDDPRIDLAEAKVAEVLDDFTRQRVAAERAVSKGESRGLRSLVAEARRFEGMAFASLGEPKKARVAFEEAKEIFGSARDEFGAALVQHEIAEMLHKQGDLQEAATLYSELLVFFRRIGNKRSTTDALDSIASLLVDQGHLARAAKVYDETLTAMRQIRDRSGEAAVLLGKGQLLLFQGDLAGARKTCEESLALSRNIKERSAEADALDSIASVLIREGDLDAAGKKCGRLERLMRQ